MDGEGSSKKARKPYTITKVRDRWSEEEHERFLDALLLFGSEWKKVEEFVGTKTVVQIRSHAQKYFLKVQKNGLMVHMPSPHSKRNHAYPFPQISSDDDNLPLQASMARPSWDGKSMLGVEGDNGFGIADIFNQKFDLAGSSSTSWLIYDAPLKENQQSPYPVTPDFAEVYNLVASIIDPESTNSFELYMQKLKEMDPVTAKTALVMMKNLTHNLSSPDFEPLKRQLLTRDMKNKATAETSDATNKSCQCLN